MSRLSLLAAVLSLTATAATTQAVIVYEPLPVPSPCSTLAPYYQQQLYVLNHPYGGYGSINFSPSNPCDRPTVDLYPQPCQNYQPCQPDTGGYFRKSDFLPHPVAPATSSLTPTSKGVILIIPKNLLNRPLKSLSPESTPLAARD